MKRLVEGLLLGLIGILLLVPAGRAQDTSPTVSESKLSDFLRERIPYREGTVSFQRGGNFYVEIGVRTEDVRVGLYRRRIRETDDGKKLVEESLGTARLVAEGPNLARLVPDDSTADTLSLGDQVRTKPIGLDVVNRTDRDRSPLETLLLDHPGIESVRFLRDRSEAGVPFLLAEDTGVSLFLTNRSRPDATLDPRGETPGRERGTPRKTLENRARFDRTVHDFEWIRLPTRSPIHLLALASEGSIGFARFEEEVTGIHWLDVPGTVLDLSIRTVSSENPGKIYFLAVMKEDGAIRTRSYSFNALDRSLREEWTANHVWIRGTADGRFYAQEVGLNVPFSRTLREVEVSGDGWEASTGDKLTFSETVVSPGYASRSPDFAYLDDSRRLRIRSGNDSERALTPEFGGDPRSLSGRRNDKSRSLQPEFALNRTGDSLRVFVPRNIPGGVTFIRGLRTYEQSRLFLLDLGGPNVETLWESNRQPGYVSATEYFEEDYWAMVVDPANDSSTLKELSAAGS